MPYENLAIIMGRLGKDPELVFTAAGTARCHFSLATTRRWTTKDAGKQEETTWHNCVAWGKTGETIKEYATKGSLLYVRGRINNWTKALDDGTKKYGSEIVVDQFQFGPKGSTKPANNGDGQDDLGF